MLVRTPIAGLSLDISDIAGTAEHLLAGGSDLDLTEFAVIAGSRLEVGSQVLNATCDRVCSRLGQLLVSVGGFVRVLQEGFKTGIRGGAATFDKLQGNCKRYDAAKKRVREAKARMEQTQGAMREHHRMQKVEAETAVALAQKGIIEALGGSLVTGSVQESAAQASAAGVQQSVDLDFFLRSRQEEIGRGSSRVRTDRTRRAEDAPAGSNVTEEMMRARIAAQNAAKKKTGLLLAVAVAAGAGILLFK